MAKQSSPVEYDFKGIGFSKIGYFKEVRSKIKELEQLNMELARRHNKLEAIIDSMNSGLTILDSDMNIVFANRLQMLMFPEVSLIGEKCHQAFFRRKKICSNCPACKTLQSQEIFRGEIRIKHGAFAGRYYEWSTSPVKSPLGRVDEVVLLMRDITRRKEAEFKLLQSDRMAAIGLLAAGIAHEINNPLTSIAGFSEALLKRVKGRQRSAPENLDIESLREYLEIIFNEAYRCKDIIQNLLEYSRKSTEDKEILEIAKTIKATVMLVRKHAKDQKIKIVFKNVLTSGFNRILGNESQIQHLLLNLLNHSLKSAGGGGELTILARNLGHLIEVLLTINGSGGSDLSVAQQSEMSCAATASPVVSEMDLSICYTIMKQHDGELRFEEDQRNRFSFTLRFPAVVA
ncbi:MAG: histidine kinase dimerization/phospho-acceptor domain-containing protein [Desulfomonilaceae bacterium]